MRHLNFSGEEILETITMVRTEQLDIRTITVGISLLDCVSDSCEGLCRNVYEKVERIARDLRRVSAEISQEYGLPIINNRIAVTPVSLIAGRCGPLELQRVAETLDRAAHDVNVDFIGGFSAHVEKGMTQIDTNLFAAIPEALAATKRVCASVNVGSTRAGLNMDAIAAMGGIIKRAAALTANENSIGCAKLVVFCNAVEDNPFMAGAFHGASEPECTVNVGVSGPGVVLRAIQAAGDADFGALASIIRRTAFKITRAGELVGRTAASRLGLPFGIVDLSLAPTPAEGDSVARILEEIGLDSVGTHGSTAALALLNDAVKKGGAMASSYVGGLSGAFIPAVGRRRHDRSRRARLHHHRQARSHDRGLFGRARHDRHCRRHAGGNDRRDHRRRSGDRHDQPENHGGAADPGRRQKRRRLGRFRRPARPRAGSSRSTRVRPAG